MVSCLALFVRAGLRCTRRLAAEPLDEVAGASLLSESVPRATDGAAIWCLDDPSVEGETVSKPLVPLLLVCPELVNDVIVLTER